GRSRSRSAVNLWILDTDILTLYREGHQAVGQQVAAHPPAEMASTVISEEEQLSGWYTLLRRAQRPDQVAHAYAELAATVSFLGKLRILSLTEAAIARYGQLRNLRLNIGRMDMRIAAIALENGGTVVTRNTRDFGRVPGLVVEDWST